jgi:flagellin
MRINNNIMAMNTHRQLGLGGAAGAKSTERLSSGFRINKAGDDAAGLAISEKMRGQIRGLGQASSNAQDSISLIQTAEGALQETHSILQRMRELAVQSANDTNTTTDRNEIQKEVDQLTNELDRIANTTEFNTQKLLNGEKEGLRDAATGVVTVEANTAATITATPADSDALDASGTIIITRTSSAAGDESDFTIGDPGTLGAVLTDITTLSDAAFGDAITLAGLSDMQVGDSVTISVKANDDGNDDASKALTMQIGANSGQTVLIGINDMRAEALGLRDGSGKALDITNAPKATAAITTINNALETVSAERSKLGSMQNRLDHSIKNLDTSAENLQASESRIRDVDMAKEMMDFTKNNILQQAAQAMLAQANQAPQGVLQLLR